MMKLAIDFADAKPKRAALYQRVLGAGHFLHIRVSEKFRPNNDVLTTPGKIVSCVWEFPDHLVVLVIVGSVGQ